MPKRSDSYMEERRRQILDAAIACITESGWNRTTIDGVAAAAGLSKGAVYVHFANKRALFFGLLARNFEDIEKAAELDTYEKLRAYMTSDLEILSKPDAWMLTAGSMEAILDGVRDPEIRAMYHRANARLVEIFTSIVSRLRPDLPPAAARTQALVIILTLEGLRSYRTTSEGLSKNAMRAILDHALQPLNPAVKSKR